MTLLRRWLGFEDRTALRPAFEQRSGAPLVAFVDYDRDAGSTSSRPTTSLRPVGNRAARRAGSERLFCHPRLFGGTAPALFSQPRQGESWRWLGYEDVTAPRPRRRRAGAVGAGASSFCVRRLRNGERWPIPVLCQHAQPNNQPVINQRRHLKEEAFRRRASACKLLGQPQANMGVSWGDVDADTGPTTSSSPTTRLEQQPCGGGAARSCSRTATAPGRTRRPPRRSPGCRDGPRRPTTRVALPRRRHGVWCEARRPTSALSPDFLSALRPSATSCSSTRVADSSSGRLAPLTRAFC